MRWVKIALAIAVINVSISGVSSAQQSSVFLNFIKPKILQSVYRVSVSDFKRISYRDISIPLKTPAKLSSKLNRIGRMRKLVNSSV